MQLDDLYQEVILDHYKHPRCHGCLQGPHASALLFNPLCGDQVQLTVKMDGDTVSEIGFSGHGCSISQASASMMSEACSGKTLKDAQSLMNDFRALMRGEKAPDDLPDLKDAVALEGVRKFSARVKCAMLAWEALEKCLSESPSASGNAAGGSNPS